MANRVVRRFPARRSSSKIWAGFSNATSFQTLPAATSQILGSFVVSAGDETIVRFRGLLSIISDQVAASEEVHGAIGVAIVSEDAFNVGITAVPTPIADIQSDAWMVWQPFAHSILFLQTDASGTVITEGGQTNVVIDSKAMRKIHTDERAVVVIENQAAAFGCLVHLDIRGLGILKGTG